MNVEIVVAKIIMNTLNYSNIIYYFYLKEKPDGILNVMTFPRPIYPTLPNNDCATAKRSQTINDTTINSDYETNVASDVSIT